MSAIPYEIVASVAVAEKEPETVREVIEWSNAHPLRWLVENFILEQAVHVLHGLEEAFKTMFMLQLHEALAKGGQFLLWETEGGLRTGIAELEMKKQMCGSRFGNFWLMAGSSCQKARRKCSVARLDWTASKSSPIGPKRKS